MLFEKIKSPGLAHNSYLIGHRGEAAVIDPRRDVEIYLQKAQQEDQAIKHVFETHRNEDYLTGSRPLKELTGAKIWHADKNLDYEYGQPMQEGKEIEIGQLGIEGFLTPGHTPGSFSYLLTTHEGKPWMVFTGDVLFAGDVGRVDFLGEDKLEETAGQLYDSIYEKILPLGEDVILCPAHGAGSVCGSTIADREWTTIGIEKKLNPHLQYDGKEEFIEEVGEILEYPPYMKKMEQVNLQGARPVTDYERPQPLSAEQFAAEMDEGAVVVDTRTEVSFAGAHIPGSLSIWKNNVPTYVGWFVSVDSPILLVSEDGYPQEEINYLFRIGYEDIKGYLADGLVDWHTSARRSDSINTVRVEQLCEIIDYEKEDYLILDVRAKEEVEGTGEISEALNIHLTQLQENLNHLPEDKQIYIFCGSGIRAMTAASVLKREGFDNINVALGGLMGWNSTTCPIE